MAAFLCASIHVSRTAGAALFSLHLLREKKIMETQEVIVPRVWICCLAYCNERRVVGDWFHAVGAVEVTTYDIYGAHSRADSHDELWCFDHECIPVSGELSPMEAVKWGEVFGAVPKDDRAALYAWVDSGAYAAEGGSGDCCTDRRR